MPNHQVSMGKKMVIGIRFCPVMIGIVFLSNVSAQQDAKIDVAIDSVWTEVQASIAVGASDRVSNLAFVGRSWPKEFSEPVMVELLKESNPELKLIACETLARLDIQKFKNQLSAALEEISTSGKPELGFRIAVLRFKLGFPQGKSDLEELAMKDPTQQKWSCPMDAEIVGSPGETCRICGMSLVEQPAERVMAALESQFSALEELLKAGEIVSEDLFRDAVAGDSDLIWRKRAACLWYLQNPDAASPHVRLFLNSIEPDVLSFVVAHYPEEFTHELVAVAKNSKATLECQTLAASGLTKSGNPEYLKILRRVAYDRNADHLARVIAIHAISEHGDSTDVSELMKEIKGDLRFFVAPAVLKLKGKSLGDELKR